MRGARKGGAACITRSGSSRCADSTPLCICVGVVCCRAGQVQVWDTQDEESMDPLLNIADGFDAEVRGGLGAGGF